MKIGHGSNSGIKGLRNLRIEGILSFNPSMPKSLNLALIAINNFQKKTYFPAFYEI
jgi:hypothetical protein